MAKPSEFSAPELVEKAFESAGNPKDEKTFLDLLKRHPLPVQSDFDRIMAEEIKPLATAATKGGLLRGAAKIYKPLAAAIAVGDIASQVLDAKKKANEEADAAEQKRREEDRKKEKREWDKGLVRFSEAMQTVNENVSRGAEVDAVADALRPLILSQGAKRQAQPLKFPGEFPNGELKRYIMRRLNGEPLPGKLFGELFPTHENAAAEGEDLGPSLQIELIPSSKGDAPKVTTSKRTEDGAGDRREKAKGTDDRAAKGRPKAKGPRNGDAG